MTLGKAGVCGSGPDLFDQPTDVLVAPNGDIFVTDSHRNGLNNRVVKFTKDGKFIKEWGTKGIRPRRDQRAAHDRDGLPRTSLRRRSREQSHPDLRSGRKVTSTSGDSSAGPVASRSRATTRSTSTDSESGPDTGAHELPGIKKGIRIGSAKDGTVTAFIEDMESDGRAITPVPKASASMRRATSTAPSSVARCWNATFAHRSNPAQCCEGV